MSQERFRMSIHSISPVGARGVKIVGEINSGQLKIGTYVRVWQDYVSNSPFRLSKTARILDEDLTSKYIQRLTSVYLDNRDILTIKRQDKLELVTITDDELQNLGLPLKIRIHDATTVTQSVTGNIKHIPIWGMVEQGHLTAGTPLKLIGQNQPDISLTKYRLIHQSSPEWIQYSEVSDFITITQKTISSEDARRMEYIVIDDEAMSNE